MDELISRKSLVDAFKAMNDTGKDCFPTSIIVETIDEAPTVDAVPVVRCNDCRHRGDSDLCHMKHLIYDEEDHSCYYDDFTMDDYYCSFGERRESDAGN